MTAREVSDEEAQAAKDVLEQAIKQYYAVVYPDVYLDDWILLSHKRSVLLEQQNTSELGMLTPTGQSWITRRGMLQSAVDADRASLFE